MIKKNRLNRLTLMDAAKLYIVYLHAVKMSYPRFRVYIRGLRHVLVFYGYHFPLEDFDGKRMLQYADIYSPYDFDPIYKERGEVFWKFTFWLKQNAMIPNWTAPEKK
jgi:hypothetical protein